MIAVLEFRLGLGISRIRHRSVTGSSFGHAQCHLGTPAGGRAAGDARKQHEGARRGPLVGSGRYGQSHAPRRRDRHDARSASGRTPAEQLPWAIVYYKAPDGTTPALEFLDSCPGKIDAQFTAVLDAVAGAPPPRFSGGGKREAMHGAMGGWYEIRLTGPGREQSRLFCLPENGH